MFLLSVLLLIVYLAVIECWSYCANCLLEALCSSLIVNMGVYDDVNLLVCPSRMTPVATSLYFIIASIDCTYFNQAGVL